MRFKAGEVRGKDQSLEVSDMILEHEHLMPSPAGLDSKGWESWLFVSQRICGCESAQDKAGLMVVLPRPRYISVVQIVSGCSRD